MYVYKEFTTQKKFIVGFFTPDGNWHEESKHDSKEDTLQRVSFLNGGAAPEKPLFSFALLVCPPGRKPYATWHTNDLNSLHRSAVNILHEANHDLPVNTKHNTKVYKLEWKTGFLPRVREFEEHDLRDRKPTTIKWVEK